MDLVIREVATTKEDHTYILTYDIAQTAASEVDIADIMNGWRAAFYYYSTHR